MTETDTEDEHGRPVSQPPTGESTSTVKFGAGARHFLIQMIGSDDPLAGRIRDHGTMQPVPFTARELKAIAYDLGRESLTANSVMNAELRIKASIRDLEDEADGTGADTEDAVPAR